MNLRALLLALGWIFVTASALVVGGFLFLESSVRSALDAAVPSGVLLALAGHLFTQSKTLADAEEKRSSFNLEGFRQAFAHALALLQPGTNQRAKWIEAARSLAHGEELAKAVTVSEHKRVLELERLKYRGLFSEILEDKPASFFYGVEPLLYPSLDEAAKASTAGEERNGRILVSSSHSLDEASIRSVWLATSWPKDYNDPLGNRFTDAELGPVMMLLPELHKFLDHQRTWASAAGKLHPRKPR